jgi:hypothetical protein
MTPNPAATAASRKTLAVSAPPKRPGEPADKPDHDDPLDVDDGLEVDDGLDVGGELTDDEAKAGVLGPEPGGEPDDPEDDEDEDDEGDGKPPDDEDDGDDEPADDDDDELDNDERDGWSPAPA